MSTESPFASISTGKIIPKLPSRRTIGRSESVVREHTGGACCGYSRRAEAVPQARSRQTARSSRSRMIAVCGGNETHGVECRRGARTDSPGGESLPPARQPGVIRHSTALARSSSQPVRPRRTHSTIPSGSGVTETPRAASIVERATEREKARAHRSAREPLQLPLLGSNQDSPDPESGALLNHSPDNAGFSQEDRASAPPSSLTLQSFSGRN